MHLSYCYATFYVFNIEDPKHTKQNTLAKPTIAFIKPALIGLIQNIL